MIPYSRQIISADDIREVVRTLRSPFLTQGPAVERFEKALREYCGARYAVAVSSGTAALHAAYIAAGIGKSDEVITTPLTFAATANMILAVGATPVFADVDETGNLDVRDVERKITKKTKAIVPVDYGGNPVDIDGIRALARKHKLVVIEDAAQALGASYKGKKIGGLADMTIFSFHPVKSITTGEGGAILTNSKEYSEKLTLFRKHGITTDKAQLKNKKLPAWYQEMQMLGFNYRLTDIQAALGFSQMRKLNSFIAKRRAGAKRYLELLRETDLVLPPVGILKDSAWHLFPVRLPISKAGKRDTVFEAMRTAGIGVQVHHVPVHTHPYYRSLGFKKGMYPKTEAFVSREISLPLFPTITPKEQRFIVKELLKALKTL